MSSTALSEAKRSPRARFAMAAGLALAMGLMAFGAADARAATGSLAPAQCFEDTGKGTVCDDIDVLDDAFSATFSPDGTSAYAVSSTDGALINFDRDPQTGTLSFRECFQDTGGGAPCTVVAGLGDARDVDVSDDGRSVYVVARSGDNALLNFSRNPSTGALTYRECFERTGGGTGCTDVLGLENPFGVDVSPDGRSVYVAYDGFSPNGGLVNFDRSTATGALTFNECFEDVGGGTACIDQDGLADADEVAVSPDSRSLYVVSGFDDSALLAFDRNTSSGDLALSQCFEDTGQGTACTDVDRMGTMFNVSVSPDGRSVYATAFDDNTLFSFDRDADGDLTLNECFEAPLGATACADLASFVNPGGIMPSPDGLTVYVTAGGSDAVHRFDRSLLDGGLAEVQCFEDTGKGTACADTPGLDAPRRGAVSPDGRSLFLASQVDDALVGFDRQDAPQTSFDGGPGATTSDNTPTFTFSTDTPGAGTQCKVDAGEWEDCVSPYTAFALADGAHRFGVKGVDAAGNADPTPASFDFTVNTTPPPSPDTTAPDTDLTSAPGASVTTKKKKYVATFAFSSSEAGSTFQCSVDGGAFFACASGQTAKLKATKSGKAHSFRVRAVDAAGNADFSSEKWSGTVRRK